MTTTISSQRRSNSARRCVSAGLRERVDAQQFAWQLNPSTVRVGVPVAFVTRSQDVNHGFGIYKGHTFIAQIQVVPDRNSTLIHTFHETGIYTVLCLEFCGVGHHGMVATFTVTK